MNRRTHLLVAAALASALSACSQDHAAEPEQAPADAAPPPTEGATPAGSETAATTPDESTEPPAATEKPPKKTLFPDGPQVGQPAPDFTLSDDKENEHHLAELRGKPVVLLWFNPACQYSEALYLAGSVRGLSTRWKEKGVHWFEVNSNAPDTEGHGLDLNQRWIKKWSIGNPMLFDESGEVGRAYGILRTPEAVVIDGEGRVVYRGAIDNAPLNTPLKGKVVINHVDEALKALEEGRPVDPAEVRVWGCRIPYAE